MMDVSGAVVIRRPIGEVFASWAALERSPEYAASVIECRMLQDGPTRKGARFHVIEQWPGRRIEFVLEITAFQAPARLAATCSDPMAGGWDAIFEDVDGATELRFEATIDPGGLMGVVAPLLHPWVARRTRSSLAAFRDWVESGKAASSTP
jgi:uncharacterized membrane protein